MNQPIPKVTLGDVDRIVRRDFDATEVASVLAALERYGRETWHCEVPRVRLAILKLAGGRPDRLPAALALADQDYRDILVTAEYPRYFREIPPSVPDATKADRAIAADWEQYRDWFERK